MLICHRVDSNNFGNEDKINLLSGTLTVIVVALVDYFLCGYESL